MPLLLAQSKSVQVLLEKAQRLINDAQTIAKGAGASGVAKRLAELETLVHAASTEIGAEPTAAHGDS